jgi:hypothetical protein
MRGSGSAGGVWLRLRLWLWRAGRTTLAIPISKPNQEKQGTTHKAR